jgi:hypothetical protein
MVDERIAETRPRAAFEAGERSGRLSQIDREPARTFEPVGYVIRIPDDGLRRAPAVR